MLFFKQIKPIHFFRRKASPISFMSSLWRNKQNANKRVHKKRVDWGLFSIGKGQKVLWSWFTQLRTRLVVSRQTETSDHLSKERNRWCHKKRLDRRYRRYFLRIGTIAALGHWNNEITWNVLFIREWKFIEIGTLLVILPKNDLETPLKKRESERDFYLKRRKWHEFLFENAKELRS